MLFWEWQQTCIGSRNCVIWGCTLAPLGEHHGMICAVAAIRAVATVTLAHTHPFNGPFSGTTQVSRFQKGNTNLDFCEARDSEWQWHQLGRMQVCTSLQTDNHASTPPGRHSVVYRPDALPAAQPTASKHWRQLTLFRNLFGNVWHNFSAFDVPSVLWRCWFGGMKGIRPVKNISCGVLAWLFVSSDVHICIWPSCCHCHSLSLAPIKSRLVLPFWYRLTWVVPDKGPLNCVCMA